MILSKDAMPFFGNLLRPAICVRLSGRKARDSFLELVVRWMLSLMPFLTGARPSTFLFAMPLYFIELRPVRLFGSLVKTGMFFCFAMKELLDFTHSQRSSVDGKA